MRNFIQYLRECFCKHEFEYEEGRCVIRGDGWFVSDTEKVREGIKVSVTCKKCSYHKKYWKF